MHYSNALLFVRHHLESSIRCDTLGLRDALRARHADALLQDEVVYLSHADCL
jgi:hypothetical protein